MSGPDLRHRDLTSGHPGTLSGLLGDLDHAMHQVRAALDHIVLAQSTPQWSSPEAASHFNRTALATRASAEMGHLRLNRAKLAVAAVAAQQTRTIEQADKILAGWRRAKREETSAIILKLTLEDVMDAFDHVEQQLDHTLTEAREFIATDGLSATEREWFRNGLARSMQWALDHPEVPLGPMIPTTRATGDDGGWTPQGLGYDPATGTLLQTSYRKDDAELSIVDPDTGELLQHVRLGAPVDPEGRPTTPPDHAGGVVVQGGRVYVTSSPDHLYSYDLDAIRRTPLGEQVPVAAPPQRIEGAAYATVHDGVLYTGTFTEDPDGEGRIYRYRLDDHGEWVRFGRSWPAPAQTQGVAIHDGQIVFSTSWQRHRAGSLQGYDLDELSTTGRLGRAHRVTLPTMAEGVAATPHGLLTTHESGSAAYADPAGHDPRSLWAGTHMTRTPYADVGAPGAGGDTLEVQTHTLLEARRGLLRAEGALGTCGHGIARLTLPASAIADVAQAPAFATALDKHLDRTGEWLDHSRISADLTAAGLVSTAEDYDRADDDSGGLFGLIEKKLGGLF